MDIVEKPDCYVITAEVPGVDKDHLFVDLDVESSMLTIAAEKQQDSEAPAKTNGGGARVSADSAKASSPAEQKDAGASSKEATVVSNEAANVAAAGGGDQTWHRSERVYGRVSRSMRLPSDVDPDKVTASLDHGVLTLTLAKRVAPDVVGRKRVVIEGK